MGLFGSLLHRYLSNGKHMIASVMLWFFVYATQSKRSQGEEEPNSANIETTVHRIVYIHFWRKTIIIESFVLILIYKHILVR